MRRLVDSLSLIWYVDDHNLLYFERENEKE